MLSLFAKNVGVPKFLSLGTPTFIIEPFLSAKTTIIKRALPKGKALDYLTD